MHSSVARLQAHSTRYLTYILYFIQFVIRLYILSMIVAQLQRHVLFNTNYIVPRWSRSDSKLHVTQLQTVIKLKLRAVILGCGSGGVPP